MYGLSALVIAEREIPQSIGLASRVLCVYNHLLPCLECPEGQTTCSLSRAPLEIEKD
jgi:hypothetical protein